MTLSIMALSIMTLSKMTLSIMTFIITNSMIIYSVIRLSVIMLNAIRLNVVAPDRLLSLPEYIRLGWAQTREALLKGGRLSTFDLNVLTGLEQIIFILKILCTCFYKTSYLN